MTDNSLSRYDWDANLSILFVEMITTLVNNQFDTI